MAEPSMSSFVSLVRIAMTNISCLRTILHFHLLIYKFKCFTIPSKKDLHVLPWGFAASNFQCYRLTFELAEADHDRRLLIRAFPDGARLFLIFLEQTS